MASGAVASSADVAKSKKRARPTPADDTPPQKGLYWGSAPVFTKSIAPSRLLPGTIDPHDDPNAHAVIYRYALGSRDDLTTAVPREDVLHFFYPHALEVDGKCRTKHNLADCQMRRDLFLLAFSAVQGLPRSDKWSFYQIAGIHGLPHEPYDGAKGIWVPSAGSDWWGGYCQHGSPLFPTWHRPYMLLLEQSIIRQAKLIGESLSDTEEAKEVANTADKLRLPYWDWADRTTGILGLPDIFTVTEISLLYPWKSFTRRSIPNPLKSFVLPDNVGVPIASSDIFNPSAKPNYKVPPEGTPFIPLGYATVRHVTPAYTTNNDQLSLSVLRNADTTLVEGAFAMFHQNEWLPFSNHSWSGTAAKTQVYGHYSSLEGVHDTVHTTLGGSGGQMSYNDVAGFDPIFFFHHSNVDRLMALWQYCYPTAWIPSDTSLQHDAEGTYTEKPDSPVDASTDLTPFRRSSTTRGDNFVSSDDVRIVDLQCGYSYPEIVRARKEKWPPARMLLYMLHLYKPSQFFIHKWFLVVERILKSAFNGPYYIRVFLDLPDADATTPLTSPNYAGSISIFARQTAVRCANCEQRPLMRSSLELTKAMLRLGIATAPNMTGDDGTVQAPRSNPLGGEGAIKLVYVNLNGDPLPNPPINPKLTVVYQEGVPDEQVYEFLLSSARNADAQSTSEVVSQCHALPKGLVQQFSVND